MAIKISAIVWLILTLSLFIMAAMLKFGLKMPRPQPDLSATSFPSGHLFSVLLYLLASTIIEQKHEAAGLLIRRLSFLLLVGVIYSRTLLQAHWIMDLLTTSAMVLTIWHQFASWPNTWKALTRSATHGLLISILLAPVALYTCKTWWHEPNTPILPNELVVDTIGDLSKVPSQRLSRTGYTLAPINIHWMGEKEDIIDSFKRANWQVIPVSANIFERLSLLIKSKHYDNVLPILPPLFAQHAPDLIFTQVVSNQEYIVRLWSIPGNAGLYIGTFSQDIYPERFFGKHLITANLNRYNIAPLRASIQQGEVYSIASLSTDDGVNSFTWDGQILQILP